MKAEKIEPNLTLMKEESANQTIAPGFEIKVEKIAVEAKMKLENSESDCAETNKIKAETAIDESTNTSDDLLICSECGYKARHRSTLHSHVIYNHSPEGKMRRFRCIYCNYKARKKLLLENHLKTQHPDEPKWLQCSHCFYKARKKESLESHMIKKHITSEKNNWFQCAHCDFRTETKTDLMNHLPCLKDQTVFPVSVTETKQAESQYCIKTEPPESLATASYFKWPCDFCSYKTNFRGDLRKHNISRHMALEKISWQQCPHCPHKTKHKNNLGRHIKDKHTSEDKINWQQCPHCPYKAKTSDLYKKHQTHKHADFFKSFKCDFCPFNAKRRHSLQRHVISMHTAPEEIKWLKCDQCDYLTKTKERLTYHVRFKHENKTFQCSKCPFSTKMRKTFNRHMQKDDHSLIEILPCFFCSYKTKRQSNLYIHIAQKHKLEGKEWLQGQVKPEDTSPVFPCEQCGYKAKRRHRLEEHVIRIHTALNELTWAPCEQCDFKGKTKEDLRLHVRRKHLKEEVQFECSECSFKAKHKSSLKMHFVTKHTSLSFEIRKQGKAGYKLEAVVGESGGGACGGDVKTESEIGVSS